LEEIWVTEENGCLLALICLQKFGRIDFEREDEWNEIKLLYTE
jgi:hypothetical protein